MDKMREEFEAWAKPEGIDINVFADGEQNAGEYYFLEAHCAWRSWLASRAALRVDLPGAWILAEHEYKRQVEESLDSAGVSYE